MKLYHGTSIRHLDSIITHGLRPRIDAPGHWEQYPSRPDMVYLAGAYPFFFAMHTDNKDGHGNRQPEKVVIEIDSARLDQRLLYPDEDFVAQLIAEQIGKPLAEIHDDIRANLTEVALTFQDHASNAIPAWEASIAALATCCCQGAVPRAAMTRYCLFDWQLRPLLAAMAYNEGPYLGGPHEQHRQLTLWMFGHRRRLPRFVPTNILDRCPGVATRLGEAEFAKQEKNRTGVTVVNL